MYYYLPYLLCYFFLFVFMIPLYNYSNKYILERISTEIYLFILFVSLLFMGWGAVGYDSLNYYKMFDEAILLTKDGWLSVFNKSEWLFRFFMAFIKTIFPNYYFFRFIYTFLDLILLTVFFHSYCEKSLWPICFLFFFIFGGAYWEIEAIRNGKAVMLYLVSLKYFHQKRMIKFIFINVLAFGFHVSAVFLFIGTFFAPFFLKKKILLPFFIIGMLLVFSGIGFTKIIAGIIAPFIHGKLGSMLNFYLNSEFYGKFRGISFGYIERLISFVFIFTNAEKLVLVDKRLKIIIGSFYIYILICLYFSDVAIIYERIAALFKFPYWILFPLIYKKLEGSYEKCFLIALLFLGAIKTYTAYNNPVYAYTIMLFKGDLF